MQFNNPTIRLNTFLNWPFRTTVWPKQLSTAGFYYTGNGTCVKCFSCGVVTSVDDWNTNDLPEMTHFKLNSTCEFMKIHFPHIINKVEKDNHDVCKDSALNGTLENGLTSESYYQESLIPSEPQNVSSGLSQTAGFLQINAESNESKNFVDSASIIQQSVGGTIEFSGTRIRQNKTSSDDVLHQGELTSVARCNSNMTFHKIKTSNIKNAHATGHGTVDYGDSLDQSYDVDHPTTSPVKSSEEPRFAFPDFKQYSRRQSSFNMWPSTAKQSPNVLAGGGFFYTGVDDVVRCFCCNLGLSEWAETDDHWTEHARHNPKCWFLRQQKGQLFINNIQEDWKKRYQPRNPAFDDFATRLATFDGFRDAQQTPEMLADAGFFFTGEDDTVRCHYCDGGLRNWKDGDIPWEEHARWFPSCKFVIKMKGMAYIESIKAKYQDQANTAATKNDRKENLDLSKLRSTNNEYKSKLLCVLCKENERCMLFTNCGHRVTCEQCCGSIVACPHCNKRIKKAIKTFLC